MVDQAIENNPDLLPLREEDHILGDADALVTLVEFGDYQCPGCGEAYWSIRKIHEQQGSRFRFVFRHFPFSGIHPEAELAAQAAEAAGEQGKFWEMHDLLFENQNDLKFDDLVARAEELSLDVPVFRRELKSEKYLDLVRSDFRSGVQNGVFSTPTIFLNGVRQNGAFDIDSLTAAIELAAAR